MRGVNIDVTSAPYNKALHEVLVKCANNCSSNIHPCGGHLVHAQQIICQNVTFLKAIDACSPEDSSVSL
jgi:hypothetical protein